MLKSVSFKLFAIIGITCLLLNGCAKEDEELVVPENPQTIPVITLDELISSKWLIPESGRGYSLFFSAAGVASHVLSFNQATVPDTIPNPHSFWEWYDLKNGILVARDVIYNQQTTRLDTGAVNQYLEVTKLTDSLIRIRRSRPNPSIPVDYDVLFERSDSLRYKVFPKKPLLVNDVVKFEGTWESSQTSFWGYVKIEINKGDDNDELIFADDPFVHVNDSSIARHKKFFRFASTNQSNMQFIHTVEFFTTDSALYNISNSNNTSIEADWILKKRP